MTATAITGWILLLMLISLAHISIGFNYPGGYFHTYSAGDELYAKVSSLTSIESLIPFSYYSLPYCKPPWGIKKSEENLGELLMGVQTLNSPYRFRVDTDESVYLCTTSPLTKHDVDRLKNMTREMYSVNILLDGLPAQRYTNKNGISIKWTGFPVGYYIPPSIGEGTGSYYILNHLKFHVFVHKRESYKMRQGFVNEIVGFQVTPCSVSHDPKKIEKSSMFSNDIGSITCPTRLDKAQIIEEGERISFSYEVEFLESDLQLSSRWDTYLKMEGSHIHWFSIINSAITALFLTGVAVRIFFGILKERAGYQSVDSSDKEAQPEKLNDEIITSEQNSSDVLKGPKLKKLLCVMVGSGSQILGMAIVTIYLAALGFMSPASQGWLLVGIVSFYVILGFVGGYVSVYLWKAITGSSESWRSISGYVASGFPGFVFAIHFSLNLIFQHQKSTGAIPYYVYLEILSLWLGILVPSTLLGGYLGAQADDIKFPARIEWIPRKDGARKFTLWILTLGAGTLPFGTIFIELFFILSSLFLGRYYYLYGYLLAVLLLLIIVCALASMIVAYMSIQAEDSGWWWKAFWASGSAGGYVFLYCIIYLINDLRGLNGREAVIIYLGYSVLMATMIILAAGSIGVLGCFYLVTHMSSAKEIVKIFDKVLPAQDG